MAMGRIYFELKGITGVNHVLHQLQGEVTTKGIATCLRVACKPLINAMKASVPVKTGTLKASIGAEVRSYPSKGYTVAIIGPRSKFRTRRGGQVVTVSGRPTRYAHLVEKGTRAHLMHHMLIGGHAVRRDWMHPGGTAHPFMGPAQATQGNAAMAAMTAEFKRQIALYEALG